MISNRVFLVWVMVRVFMEVYGRNVEDFELDLDGLFCWDDNDLNVIVLWWVRFNEIVVEFLDFFKLS